MAPGRRWPRNASACPVPSTPCAPTNLQRQPNERATTPWTTIKILILAGSLRRDSYNRALARAAAQLAPSGVSTATFDGLGAIPFYDGDLEVAGLPATVVALRRAIVEADALLLVTPEYNGSTSGVLKNALDWASRGPDRILAGKPVAVMGASTGGSGARGGIESVVRILTRTRRADVLDRVVAVPFAARARSTTTWPCADAEIRAEVAELRHRARRPRSHQHAPSPPDRLEPARPTLGVSPTAPSARSAIRPPRGQRRPDFDAAALDLELRANLRKLHVGQQASRSFYASRRETR